MAGKSRSKSPKGKKGGGGFSLDDPNVATLVNAGVCVGLCFALGGGFQDQNSLTNFFFGDNAIPFWPFGNFVLTMHCLNTCSGVGSGKFWVNAFVQAYFACFAGVIVPAIVAGNAGSLMADETNATLVFVCWYLTNHNLPFVSFDVWGAISDAGGSHLQGVMDLCSNCFTTGLIIAGAGATSQAGWFGNSWFAPMAGAVMAGCAADFFPLNKGIKVNNNAATNRALWIGFFLASNGCSALPFVGPQLGGVLSQVTGHFGGNVGFVQFLTIFNHLFGHFVPMNPLDNVEEIFYKVSGLSH